MHEINHIMYVFLYHISNMYTPILKYVLQLFITTKKFSDEFLIKMNHNHNISALIPLELCPPHESAPVPLAAFSAGAQLPEQSHQPPYPQ
jgi:hypothetical protein